MLLEVLKYPDPRLHTVAQPIACFDAELKALAADMAETMYALNGVGLAATQVNVHRRIIVVDVSAGRDQLQVLVNPEIVQASGEKQAYEEGCLSVPEVHELVERPRLVRVKAQDLAGTPLSFDADELLAVCVQHEIDHLNGIVFVQHLSSLKRSLIWRRLTKLQRSVKKQPVDA